MLTVRIAVQTTGRDEMSMTAHAGTSGTHAFIAVTARRRQGRTRDSATPMTLAICTIAIAFTNAVPTSVATTAPTIPKVEINQPTDPTITISRTTFMISRNRVRAWARSTPSTANAEGTI